MKGKVHILVFISHLAMPWHVEIVNLDKCVFCVVDLKTCEPSL